MILFKVVNLIKLLHYMYIDHLSFWKKKNEYLIPHHARIVLWRVWLILQTRRCLSKRRISDIYGLKPIHSIFRGFTWIHVFSLASFQSLEHILTFQHSIFQVTLNIIFEREVNAWSARHYKEFELCHRKGPSTLESCVIFRW